jgi:hypothetical protein
MSKETIMQVILQIFIFAVIFGSIFLLIFWIATDRPNKGIMFFACLIAVIISLAYSWRDSITELTIKNIGTIKRAAKQATDDANEISKIKNRMEEIQKQLTDKLDEVNVNLSKLELLTSYLSTINEAQSDSREAFDRLVSWSNDTTFAFATEAKQAYLSVLNQEDGKIFIKRSTLEWSDEIDPEKITIDQLIKEYWNMQNVFIKINILGYIWKRDNYSKRKKMEFLLQVMIKDRSIKCVLNASHYFNEDAKLNNFSPLINLVKYQEWYDKNINKYN